MCLYQKRLFEERFWWDNRESPDDSKYPDLPSHRLWVEVRENFSDFEDREFFMLMCCRLGCCDRLMIVGRFRVLFG